LSNPHIAVLDGEEASIKVIQQQPYAELQFESGSTNVVGKTYKFIDVGVTLGVTPRINEQGYITVDIKPDVSSIIGTYDSASGQGVPIVKKSVAETSVSVKDGVTIIIGGLIDEVDAKDTVGLPLLSRIPFLGALFRSTSIVKQNSELIVLLTPRIVTGDRFFERSKDMKKQLRSAPAATVPPAVSLPVEEPL
jgi:type II secretory pathway component GspD/PulD (secretin)